MQFFFLENPPTASVRRQGWTIQRTIPALATPRAARRGEYIGMRPWLPPYRVEFDTRGREYGDLAFPTASDILVPLRFKQFWERQGLIGLSGFEPVEVVMVKRHRKLSGDPPPYFKAAVSLSRAVVDNVLSGVELEQPPTCSVCQLGSGIKRWKAIIIKPETWSGEDIFRPRWAGGLFVTSRFKRFCESNDVKNAVFIPAEEYGHDFYPWEKGSSGSGGGSRSGGSGSGFECQL